MDIFDLLYSNFKFQKDKPIKLFEAFAGIGTQHLALKNIGVNVDLVGISEIDEYAIKSYEAIHGSVKNYGGIGSFERLPDGIDICTWSFPCQDISLAGEQKGMIEGSRSNFGYIFLETVEKTVEKPKILLMENVRALISEKFKDDWREIQLRLESLGYTNYAEILNSKDYGIAQNRERVFIVSILGEYNYNFPKPIDLDNRLKDYLENEVDSKYYLSKRMIEALSGINYKGDYPRAKQFRPHSKESKIAYTITTRAGTRPPDNYILVQEKTKKGYTKAYAGDGVYISRPHQKRGVVQKSMIQTIKTNVHDIGVVTSDLKIRKLTPKETWRLMGIDDHHFEKAQEVNSDTQLYKQAGNAIVVPVLENIFKQLF